MNALQQLAEREFPKRTVGIGVGQIDVTKRERLAFIYGAKLGPKFARWIEENKGKYYELSIDEAFEEFLSGELNEHTFYCADWNRCGSICEQQCPACHKTENM